MMFYFDYISFGGTFTSSYALFTFQTVLLVCESYS